MSIEDNKALVRRFYDDCINAGNLALMDELFSPDYLHHDSTLPPEWHDAGLAVYKQLNETFTTTFVPFRVEVTELFAEGDRVASRWIGSGNQVKEFQGIAPTGNHVEFEHLAIHSIADGKIAEAWVSYDAMGLLRQLGVNLGS